MAAPHGFSPIQKRQHADTTLGLASLYESLQLEPYHAQVQVGEALASRKTTTTSTSTNGTIDSLMNNRHSPRGAESYAGPPSSDSTWRDDRRSQPTAEAEAFLHPQRLSRAQLRRDLSPNKNKTPSSANSPSAAAADDDKHTHTTTDEDFKEAVLFLLYQQEQRQKELMSLVSSLSQEVWDLRSQLGLPQRSSSPPAQEDLLRRPNIDTVSSSFEIKRYTASGNTTQKAKGNSHLIASYSRNDDAQKDTSPRRMLIHESGGGMNRGHSSFFSKSSTTNRGTAPLSLASSFAPPPDLDIVGFRGSYASTQKAWLSSRESRRHEQPTHAPTTSQLTSPTRTLALSAPLSVSTKPIKDYESGELFLANQKVVDLEQQVAFLKKSLNQKDDAIQRLTQSNLSSLASLSSGAARAFT